MAETPGVDRIEVIESGLAVRHGVLRLTFADGLTAELAVLGRMRGPVLDSHSRALILRRA